MPVSEPSRSGAEARTELVIPGLTVPDPALANAKKQYELPESKIRSQFGNWVRTFLSSQAPFGPRILKSTMTTS